MEAAHHKTLESIFLEDCNLGTLDNGDKVAKAQEFQKLTSEGYAKALLSKDGVSYSITPKGTAYLIGL